MSEEGLRAAFEQTCHEKEPPDDPEDVLRGCIGDEDVDEYWRRVGANLRAGRIRMVFVADRISREVQRIVEFLNDQLERTEVLTIEIRQYRAAGDQSMMLVPRLVGQTARAQARKSTPAARGPARDWDAEAVLADLRARVDAGTVSPEASAVADRVLEWARGRNIAWECSGGSKEGSIRFHFQAPSGAVAFLLLYSHGSLNLNFGALASARPYSIEAKRQELAERLERIDGVAQLKVNGRTAVKLAALHGTEAFDAFFAIMDDVIGTLDAV